MDSLVSVIIRTKNEEVWIDRTLTAIYLQSYRNFEVIVVDNESTDKTIEIVKKFPCKLVNISKEEFSFGRAINQGIEHSAGELIAIISGHCIPVNDQWIDRLTIGFDDPLIAAVYGRQEPLPDSSPFDKRDLWTTFGMDRRVQVHDYFFHNANSMIRRDMWNEAHFDEDLSGVEDRDWAKKMIEQGYRIVYEPGASVYHHHGIHQDWNRDRCERVVRVIELIQNGKSGIDEKIMLGKLFDKENRS